MSKKESKKEDKIESRIEEKKEEKIENKKTNIFKKWNFLNKFVKNKQENKIESQIKDKQENQIESQIENKIEEKYKRVWVIRLFGNAYGLKEFIITISLLLFMFVMIINALYKNQQARTMHKRLLDDPIYQRQIQAAMQIQKDILDVKKHGYILFDIEYIFYDETKTQLQYKIYHRKGQRINPLKKEVYDQEKQIKTEEHHYGFTKNGDHKVSKIIYYETNYDTTLYKPVQETYKWDDIVGEANYFVIDNQEIEKTEIYKYDVYRRCDVDGESWYILGKYPKFNLITIYDKDNIKLQEKFINIEIGTWLCRLKTCDSHILKFNKEGVIISGESIPEKEGEETRWDDSFLQQHKDHKY
ncbi:hypothetical protein CWO85_01000 [Candidatus Phytoplasma ziziphi]|uniref:Uncharacterized protein n=2 Tax=Acholeplasmataceae TaxID=2146 RepID=A0A660HM57_ZIZJU|nr:hypothetical protein CWO85_01000 [Candidatus Phytoplasma ziziphi]